MGAGPRRAGHTAGPARPGPPGGEPGRPHRSLLPRAEQRSAAARPLPSLRHLPPHRPGGGQPRLSQNSLPPRKVRGSPTPPRRPRNPARPRTSAEGPRPPAAAAPRTPRARRLRSARLGSAAGQCCAPAAPPTPAPHSQWAPPGLSTPRGAPPPCWAANGGAGPAARGGAPPGGARARPLGAARGDKGGSGASCRCAPRREPLAASGAALAARSRPSPRLPVSPAAHGLPSAPPRCHGREGGGTGEQRPLGVLQHRPRVPRAGGVGELSSAPRPVLQSSPSCLGLCRAVVQVLAHVPWQLLCC